MKPGVSTESAAGTLKATRVIFAAIAAGLFIFLLAALILNQLKGPLAPDLLKYRRAMTIGILLLSFAGLLAAKKMFNQTLTTAKDSLIPLVEKLNLYRAALIKYMVACELPAMAGIILFLLTGHFLFLVFAAVMLGCMLAVAPVKQRVITLLELDGVQQQELEH